MPPSSTPATKQKLSLFTLKRKNVQAVLNKQPFPSSAVIPALGDRDRPPFRGCSVSHHQDHFSQHTDRQAHYMPYVLSQKATMVRNGPYTYTGGQLIPHQYHLAKARNDFFAHHTPTKTSPRSSSSYHDNSEGVRAAVHTYFLDLDTKRRPPAFRLDF